MNPALLMTSAALLACACSGTNEDSASPSPRGGATSSSGAGNVSGVGGKSSGATSAEGGSIASGGSSIGGDNGNGDTCTNAGGMGGSTSSAGAGIGGSPIGGEGSGGSVAGEGTVGGSSSAGVNSGGSSSAGAGGGPNRPPNTITDPRDGNTYETVNIGNQTWLAENLRYLPEVVGPSAGSATAPRYYVYGYDGTNVASAKSHVSYSTYGVLYNWPAALAAAASSTANPSGVQGICPSGWHLPSEAEWDELAAVLGGAIKAGGKMKTTTGWNSPNAGATNESGFSALPGGSRRNEGAFGGVGNISPWWSTGESSGNFAWGRLLIYQDAGVTSSNSSKSDGNYCRCVRD